MSQRNSSGIFTAIHQGFQSAKEVYAESANPVRIITGSQHLDDLLGGGIELMGITELFGESGAGKTQICHTIAVTCQLPTHMGGGSGKCLYIHTGCNFRPERLISVAERYNLDEKTVLSQVMCVRVYNVDHLDAVVKQAESILTQSQYSLLIVDSSTALFCADYPDDLVARQTHLGKFLNSLKLLIAKFRIAIVITNQIVFHPSGPSVSNSSDAYEQSPVGGNVIAHASTTRLHLQRAGTARLCKIIKSPSLPENHTLFVIGRGGICDLEKDQ